MAFPGEFAYLGKWGFFKERSFFLFFISTLRIQKFYLSLQETYEIKLGGPL